MSGKLGTTIKVIAVYLLVLGVLFLFLPGTVESIMGIALPDPALTMLYGQVILTMAYLAYYVARDARFAKLYAVFVFLFGGHVVLWFYQLTAGISTFAQVGPPMIVSLIFTVLLLVFGMRK